MILKLGETCLEMAERPLQKVSQSGQECTAEGYFHLCSEIHSVTKKDSVFWSAFFWICDPQGGKDGRLIVSYQGAISAVTSPIATNKALQNRCKLLLSLCLKTTPQHLKKKIARTCIFSIHDTLKSAGGLREIGKRKLWAISGLANQLFLLLFCFGHL